MPRKQYIRVAVEDVHTIVVGSVDRFNHKLRMANSVQYRESAVREQNRPKTFAEVLGIIPKPTKSGGLVVNVRQGQLKIEDRPVFNSMGEMLGLAKGHVSMRMALDLA